jgi:hypothetical protein
MKIDGAQGAATGQRNADLAAEWHEAARLKALRRITLSDTLEAQRHLKGNDVADH